MRLRLISLRFLIVLLSSAAVFATSFALSRASGFGLFAYVESLSETDSTSVAPLSPATPGTCDSLSGGLIEVEGTGGGGTQTGYANLVAAFASINNGLHTGTITVDICGSTPQDDPAILLASGSGVSNYTSIVISPAGGLARTIASNINSNGLIVLDGADNVTIDGLNTDGNSLTLVNESTQSIEQTSTVRFINDATGNRIQNTEYEYTRFSYRGFFMFNCSAV